MTADPASVDGGWSQRTDAGLYSGFLVRDSLTRTPVETMLATNAAEEASAAADSVITSTYQRTLCRSAMADDEAARRRLGRRHSMPLLPSGASVSSPATEVRSPAADGDNVRVFCRFRPPNEREAAAGSSVVAKFGEDTVRCEGAGGVSPEVGAAGPLTSQRRRREWLAWQTHRTCCARRTSSRSMRCFRRRQRRPTCTSPRPKA